MLYRVRLAWAGFELTTLVAIGTDYIGSYKSNYYAITTTMAPSNCWPSLSITKINDNCSDVREKLKQVHRSSSWIIQSLITVGYIYHIKHEIKDTIGIAKYVSYSEWSFHFTVQWFSVQISAADAKATQTRLRCSQIEVILTKNIVDCYEISISHLAMDLLLFK